MKRRLFASTVLGLVFAAGVAAPVRAAFEDVEVDPRSRAMGGVFIAFGDDVYAPLHNPASLADTEFPQGAVSWVRPFGYDFSDQVVATATLKLPKEFGGVGVALRRFSVGYEGVDLTGETTVSVAHGFRLLKDYQSEVTLGYSLNLYSLDYGLSVGYEDHGIDPGSGQAVGVNLAAQAVLRGRTRVGFYSMNINNTNIGKDDEQLRRRVGVGVNYQPYRGVETALDISGELGEQIQYRGGIDFQVVDFLWLRTGIRTEPNIYSFGAGIRLKGFMFDYGFSTGGGVLDDTHQVAIGYRLPE